MARAEGLTEDRKTLYERDFCLWLEQQAALLREGRFDELDLANLIEEEIEAMTRQDQKAIKRTLVVLSAISSSTSSSPSSAPAAGAAPASSTGSVCATTSRRARACGRTQPPSSRAPMPTSGNEPAPRRGCRSVPSPSPARTR